jgi:hypothetical protein
MAISLPVFVAVFSFFYEDSGCQPLVTPPIFRHILPYRYFRPVNLTNKSADSIGRYKAHGQTAFPALLRTLSELPYSQSAVTGRA